MKTFSEAMLKVLKPASRMMRSRSSGAGSEMRSTTLMRNGSMSISVAGTPVPPPLDGARGARPRTRSVVVDLSALESAAVVDVNRLPFGEDVQHGV